MFWSFNRNKDYLCIEKQEKYWQGPFSWPKFEDENGLDLMPDKQGVYIFTFPFGDGFLLYLAGITNSTRRRFSEHTREYRNGNYNILDVESAMKGIRLEKWHGWKYAKNHRKEFLEREDSILDAVNKQLATMHIFICEIDDSRIRERMEAAIMMNIYTSREFWSELADRGMHVKVRANCELPIEVFNCHNHVIHGLPSSIEI